MLANLSSDLAAVGVFVISLLVKAHLSRAFVPSCVAEVIVLQLAVHV